MRVFRWQDLQWRDDGNGLVLCYGRRALVRVVPDDHWPNMWRVRLRDGRLSDLSNITRAKDAAISIALADLKTEETALEGVYVRAREGAAA